MAMSSLSLPDDMFFEILSWLPVNSLLRFKCVSKTWCSTIEDPMFIVKHWKQCPRVYVYDDTDFTFVRECKGLILERRRNSNETYTYRLRNPATRQILDLPSSIEETKGIPTVMCYVPSTNELNVIYEHLSRQGNREVLTYNVLRVGTDSTWKSLVSPLFGDLEHSMPSVWPVRKVIDATLYYARSVGNLLSIDCLDLKNYSIKNIKSPLNSLCKRDWVWFVDWEEYPSLAYIEQEQLNIHVLENYKSRKWGDSKIVQPLTFLRNCPDANISDEKPFPVSVKGNVIMFTLSTGVFSFNIQSKEVKYLTLLSTKLNYAYKPSLVPLHFKVNRQTQESANQLPRALPVCSPHTCMTSLSVFQYESSGEPVGQYVECTDVEARRTRAQSATARFLRRCLCGA